MLTGSATSSTRVLGASAAPQAGTRPPIVEGKGLTKKFAAGKTGKNMESTLARIEQLVT